jgi:hypothetical protein
LFGVGEPQNGRLRRKTGVEIARIVVAVRPPAEGNLKGNGDEPLAEHLAVQRISGRSRVRRFIPDHVADPIASHPQRANRHAKQQ